MAILGYDEIGVYTGTFAGNTKIGCKFNLPTPATVEKLYAYLETSLGSYPFKVKAAIYSDNGGLPDALLGSSPEVELTIGAKWVEFTFSSPIVLSSADFYWLALLFYTNGATNWYEMHADLSGVAKTNDDNYGDGFSDPFGTPDDSYGFKFSIYCPYTLCEYIPHGAKSNHGRKIAKCTYTRNTARSFAVVS